ncbi:MAG: endonuclease V, partial [Pleurocapsa sp.]
MTQDSFQEIKYVAGVDLGFKDNYTISQAAIAILSFPELELIETAIAS